MPAKIKPSAQARIDWEREQIAKAVGFTSCRWEGHANYQRQDHKTYDEALARADQHRDRRTMVYAVTASGRSIHIDANNAPGGRVPA